MVSLWSQRSDLSVFRLASLTFLPNARVDWDVKACVMLAEKATTKRREIWLSFIIVMVLFCSKAIEKNGWIIVFDRFHMLDFADEARAYRLSRTRIGSRVPARNDFVLPERARTVKNASASAAIPAQSPFTMWISFLGRQHTVPVTDLRFLYLPWTMHLLLKRAPAR